MTIAPLGVLTAHLITLGYRVEVDPDGTERLIRPDGSVALTAEPPSAQNTPKNGTSQSRG